MSGRIFGAPGISNFDHEIDEGLEEYLKNGGTEARHAAWDFNGHLSFDQTDGLFHEEVWVYKQVVDNVSAPTLKELMEKVNNEYGWM